MRSERAGFSYDDGSSLQSFNGAGGEPPDGGSSDPVFGASRRRNQYMGQHEHGPIVFQFVTATERTWRFRWTAISTTFFTWLQGFARTRRFLYWPDIDQDQFYKVRCVTPQLPIQERGPNLISTEMVLEEW